jgi:hypothetical protein
MCRFLTLVSDRFPETRSSGFCPGCVKTRSKIEREEIDPPERATIHSFDVGYGFDTPENES